MIIPGDKNQEVMKQVDENDEEVRCYFCGEIVDPDDDRGMMLLVTRNYEVPVCGECANAMWEEDMANEEPKEGGEGKSL